jgi:hypothetical protein
MDTSLRLFASQFFSVVIAALAPVVLVTFLSIPFTLGGHPGDVRSASALAGQHMT